MGRIDDALASLQRMPYGTERAMQMAGLISTLFRIKGVELVAIRQLAFHAYADTQYDHPELELAPFAGSLPPRTILDVMRGQLGAKGSIYHWSAVGMVVRFHDAAQIVNRNLCRDFTTPLGAVKLLPVEEIAADYILASVHPAPDAGSYVRAHRLLYNGMTDHFDMNWQALQSLCHRPEYRVGEDLAQMRIEAKREADARGMARDPIGGTKPLPKLSDLARAEEAAGTGGAIVTAAPNPEKG